MRIETNKNEIYKEFGFTICKNSVGEFYICFELWSRYVWFIFGSQDKTMHNKYRRQQMRNPKFLFWYIYWKIRGVK